jgi:hypothetical protein
VKTWTIATHRALYFDATAPPPGEWTLIGSNPPEIGAVRGTAFRMSALSVHGKTVVVLIKSRRSNGLGWRDNLFCVNCGRAAAQRTSLRRYTFAASRAD